MENMLLFTPLVQTVTEISQTLLFFYILYTSEPAKKLQKLKFFITIQGAVAIGFDKSLL